jgi:hypothetical protein
VHDYSVRDVGDVHSEWESFAFWGYAGSADVDVAAICGPGREAASIAMSQNFGTVMAAIFTLGIYSPRMAYVSCGQRITALAGAPLPGPVTP